MSILMIESYLQRAGLQAQLAGYESRILEEMLRLNTVAPVDTSKVQWQYFVPELGEGGACSLFGQLADEPYSLAKTLGQNQDVQQRLQQLSAWVLDYQDAQQSDWFGIYQKRPQALGESVLVKLAYFGAPSRAEFPLTEAFAAISNNSRVGLTGVAKVINDVTAYVTTGGEYYTCDPKVLSEACLPLFSAEGEIVGIIDAEAFRSEAYSIDALVRLVALCLVIPSQLPAL